MSDPMSRLSEAVSGHAGAATTLTSVDFICSNHVAGVLRHFRLVPGMQPLSGPFREGGDAYPASPWGPPSVPARHGCISGVPVRIEVWRIDESETQVRLSSHAEWYDGPDRLAALLVVKAALKSRARSAARPNEPAQDGFSYVAGSRIERYSDEASELLQEESRALRSDSGNALLRSRRVSLGLVDYPRRRLVVALDAASRHGVPSDNCGITPPPGFPEVPLREMPGVIVLNPGYSRDAFSLTVSPDGGTVATMYYGGRGFISCHDTHTGERRLVTSLDDIGGSERPVFSPDGEWMLVSGWRVTRLVRCSDGATLTVPGMTGGACWYAMDGELGLLNVGAGTGDELLPERVTFFGLRTMTQRQVGEVTAPEPHLPAFRRLLIYPVSGPDGRILVGSSCGPPPDYQEENGSRNRVAILDPATMSLTHVVTPFADRAGLVEREHKMWTWNSPYESDSPVEIAGALMASAVPRSSQSEPEVEEYQEQVLLLIDLDSPAVTGHWGYAAW